MRGMPLLGAAVALLAGVLVAAIVLAGAPRGGPTPRRAPTGAPHGPFAVAAGHEQPPGDGRPGTPDRAAGTVRAGLVTELTARLKADPALRGVHPESSQVVDRRALAAAERMERDICAGNDRRDECHRAVASEAVRSLWLALRQSADQRREVQLLVDFGTGLRMTESEIVNAIRAELDQRLTMAVTRGTLTTRERRVALACFDAPDAC